MMNAIIWPEGYLPGYTDNFCSNEVIIKGLDIQHVWFNLVNAYVWPEYYKNSADITLPNHEKVLKNNMEFFFKTFGFPVNAKIVELVEPSDHQPARIAWHGWSGVVGADDRLDVHHAWLIEKLSKERIRILTQETQNGKPAINLAKMLPNPMINGHQEWLDGLVSYSR